MAIHCVEESSLLDDSMATRLATTVREAAFYSIEYWVEAKEQEEHLDESVELILYRFASCLLSIGGAEMLPSSLMEKCSSLLLQAMKFFCSQVTWICRSSGLGFSLTYPSIILHAVSTDLSTFPHECIYVLVDASKSGKFPYPLDFMITCSVSLLRRFEGVRISCFQSDVEGHLSHF
ncbi:Nucleotide-sensitive chloride conductance regulator [Teladorsagia circumcincta]|uniref:Nucleotide-sensitive chloride conductance regulator n=1 Tax=Teladorsagia circumcincta TaxID=45464 RepID=A0A2G9UA27_TELCI|nr:Nucleotide-sensitive chloride conductance regulator [Teladorsagia circumcincta]